VTKTAVEVDGSRQLSASLGRFADDLDDLDRAEVAAGQVVKQRASGLAPVLTGALARSIAVSTTGDGVTVGSPLQHAAPQEFGVPGHNISAQPFLRPALAGATDEVLAAYEAEVQADLNRVKGT